MEHYSSTGEAGDESARSDYAVYESRDRLAAGRGDHLASVVPQPQEAELYLGEGCVAGGRLIKSARVKRGKQRKRCERRLLAGMIAHVDGNHHSGLKVE